MHCDGAYMGTPHIISLVSKACRPSYATPCGGTTFLGLRLDLVCNFYLSHRTDSGSLGVHLPFASDALKWTR